MKEKLQQELKDLYKAFKAGYLTTNEYQNIYYATAQRIKKLK